MNINFYSSIDKLKKFNLSTKSIAIFLTAVTMVSATAGCSNNSDTTTDSTDVVDEIIDTESVSSYDVDSVTDVASESNNGADTKTDKVEEENTPIKKWLNYEDTKLKYIRKSIGITFKKNDFRIALLLLNSDYLKNNEPEIIKNYLSSNNRINSEEDLNMNDELNTFYNVLSQIRTYNMNITNSKDYYSLNNLLLDKSQAGVLKKVEDSTKVCIDLESKYNNGKATEDDYKKAKETFELINDFQLGNIKIDNVSANELSNEAVFVVEENMKIMSLKLANFTKYNDKEYINSDDLLKFAESLNSKRAVAAVQTDWNFMAGQAIGDSETIDEDKVKEIRKMLSNQTKVLREETASMGVTKEEIYALYTIANIDYFVKDSNTKQAFNETHKKGFDLSKTLSLAESAVEKIEIYNLSVKDRKDIYDYSHLFIESVEDIYSVMYVSDISFKIHNSNSKDALMCAKELVDYSAYATDFTVTNTEGKETKYNKNSLNLGGTQVVNFITYYTLLNNKSKIDNEQLYNDGIKLVDGSSEISDVQSQIYWMLEDECLKMDKTAQYKIGSKK